MALPKYSATQRAVNEGDCTNGQRGVLGISDEGERWDKDDLRWDEDEIHNRCFYPCRC